MTHMSVFGTSDKSDRNTYGTNALVIVLFKSGRDRKDRTQI